MAVIETPPESSVEDLLDEAQWTGRIFSGGWVDAPAEIETVEPATGDLLGRAGGGDAATVARAAKAAAAAQPAWAATPFSERVRGIRRAAELMGLHRAELVGWLIRESGSIGGKAAVEVSASIGQLDMAASLISHPLGHVLPSLTPGRTSTARRVPVGVVGVITPWNFPYVLAMRSVGPALALGNAVVLKPDVNTPVSGGGVVAKAFAGGAPPPGGPPP